MAAKITFGRGCVLLVVVAVAASMACVAEASCRVENKSGLPVVLLPVGVEVSIEVAVGASVEVPPAQQKCYLKNPSSGHQVGPLDLLDGTIVAIIDGTVSGTVSAHVAAFIHGVFTLGASLATNV